MQISFPKWIEAQRLTPRQESFFTTHFVFINPLKQFIIKYFPINNMFNQKY